MIGSVHSEPGLTRATKELAMRSVISLLILGSVVGCTYAPAPQAPMVDARAQQKLSRLLAGKVAGPPQSCLPSYRQKDMTVIDDYTIAFRDGVDRVWITKPRGGCNLLASGSYALVTRSGGGLGLCRGDIGNVVDTMNHVTVGSCVLSDFIPYTTPGRR
jgi:hypothetical protein